MPRPDWLVRGTLWRLLAVDATGFELPPPGDRAWLGLEEHVRQVAWRGCRAMALVVLTMDLVGWSTDFLLVGGDPVTHVALRHMRAGAAVLCVAMFLWFHFTRVARRHPIASSAVFVFGLVGFAAYVLGTLGGIDRPFFDFLMFAIVPTVVVPGPLGARIPYLAGMVTAMCLAFFVPHPGHWSHPLVPVTTAFLASMAAMQVLIGQIVYVGTCRSYFQAREIERTAEELKSLSDGLEQQVQAKTVELRRLYEHLQLVREEERARLSRELHDELGQQLSAIGYVLATAKARSQRNPATMQESLVEVTTLLQRASETTREIARELRPPLLEQFGFVAACEWMARNVSTRLGIECVFDGAEEGPCAEPVAIAIYRVLQEALTNVGRHAEATTVRVRLRSLHGAVELSVADNGRGLPADGQRGDGLGLVGMEQRVFGLGGTFSARTAPEGGTIVQVSVPVATPASASSGAIAP